MSDLSRRRALKLSGTSLIAALGGCASSSDLSPTSTDPPPTSTPEPSTPTESPTDRSTSTEEPTTADPNKIVVDAAVSRGSGTGTPNDPFGSIQRGLVNAYPGDTVYLRSGEYVLESSIGTVRSGEPDAPITLTGPSDAVVRPAKRMVMFNLKHSHFHLTGATFDGLRDPSNPEQLSAYGGIVLVRCAPRRESDEYLTDVTIRPDGLGHSIRPLVVVKRSENVDVGAFKVTGLAGASYVLTGSSESHAGEFVYIGTPPSAYETRNHPWAPLDETNAVRVHHIDNSAGHPHSELVNTKMGTHDIIVEYCTDAGGSQNNDPYPAASAHLQSYNATVRWCRFGGGQGYGVHVNAGAKGFLDEVENPSVTADGVGDGHRIVENVIEDYDDGSIVYSKTSATAQDTVCGNSIDGTAPGSPSKSCGEDVPTGDGIGHLGGDTPWE